jgi:GNAT superfamily N-acetyltransferase
MNRLYEIRPLTDLGSELEPLITEAEGDGHRFVRRLLAEWESGTNRFDGAGELLLGAFVGDRLVGVGGLNRDPYADEDGIGRLRHVYILSAAHRLGVGSSLVRRMLFEASTTFRIVRLRTTTAEAAAFYRHLGFEDVKEDAATHRFLLTHPQIG